MVATQATGGIVTTGRVSVGGRVVRELTIVSNTVSSNEVLSNEVRVIVGPVSGSTAQQIMGSMLGGAVGGAGPGAVDVSVHVTNSVNWAEGHEYGRSQLPATNWGWVIGSVGDSVGEALGEPGGLGGVAPGHAVGSPTWSIPVRVPSGVWSWNFDVGVWSNQLGGLVKRVLEVLVLLGLWLVLHKQIVDDLRSAWSAPQARTAGQTVLGTGSQVVGALTAAAAILATLLTLTAGVLGWFAGGLGYPHTWVGELTLPSGLLGVFLRIGPWEVIVSSLTVWVGVWLARPYWIALTHGVVRFITGVWYGTCSWNAFGCAVMAAVTVTNLVYLTSVDGTNFAGYFTQSWELDRFLTGVLIGLAVGAAGYLLVIVRRLFVGPGE
jgi:hypothetical protein